LQKIKISGDLATHILVVRGSHKWHPERHGPGRGILLEGSGDNHTIPKTAKDIGNADDARHANFVLDGNHILNGYSYSHWLLLIDQFL
jgi:hypothetical protein